MAKTKQEALEALKQTEPSAYAENIAGQIERIEDSKIVIVDKLKTFGVLGSEGNHSIDKAAIAMDGIAKVAGTKPEDPSAFIMDTTRLSLPDGYYNGLHVELGDVSEEYKLQTKTIDWNVLNPQSSNTIQEDASFYGLDKVIIPAIPAKFQDVSGLTATAADVLDTKTFYGKNGKESGGMTNNGAISATLDSSKTSYTVPEGYHDGTGTVEITLDTSKNVIQFDYNNGLARTINPTKGQVFGQVTINQPNAGSIGEISSPVWNADKSKYQSKITVNPGYIATGATKTLELDKAVATASGATVNVSGGFVPAEGINTTVKSGSVGQPTISKSGDVTVTVNPGYVTEAPAALKLGLAKASATGKTVNVSTGYVPAEGISASVKTGSINKPVIADTTGIVSVAVTEGYVTEAPANLELGLAEISATGKSVKVTSGWVPEKGLSTSVQSGTVTSSLNEETGVVSVAVTEGYITAANKPSDIDLPNGNLSVSGATINASRGWFNGDESETVAAGSVSENTFDNTTGEATVTVTTGYVTGCTKKVSAPKAGKMSQKANVITAPAGYRAADEEFTMTDVGAITTSIDGLDCGASGKTVITKAEGYTAGGTVTLDATIFKKLAAI